MARESGGAGTDRMLLLEAALALVFFALMIVLYWVPSARETSTSGWWRPLLPTAVFFLILGLDGWRRKRGRRLDMRRMLEETPPPGEP